MKGSYIRSYCIDETNIFFNIHIRKKNRNNNIDIPSLHNINNFFKLIQQKWPR